MSDLRSSGSQQADRTPLLGRVELAVAGVLGAGLALGLVVWTEWGFLVAFDAVVKYCF